MTNQQFGAIMQRLDEFQAAMEKQFVEIKSTLDMTIRELESEVDSLRGQVPDRFA